MDSGTKMVLKNHADRKTGGNQSKKAYKIKQKMLVTIRNGYHDLSSNDGMDKNGLVFMRVASRFV